MAGQGWREFVAGEQLTDTKMQNFLMDQAVLRFPNAGARDSALAEVLSEGMICYLDDTDEVLYYDGTAWEQLTGDPEIFTQGTAGQFLKSLGTAGVEFADILEAAPRVAGLHFGRPGKKSSFSQIADTSFNVALGFNSSFLTDRPNANFIGNTTIGGNTGMSVTTGHQNVMVGGEAGLNVTTGIRNVIMGTSAAQQLTSGGINTIIGASAGFALTVGNGNVAIGGRALESCTDQQSNVAIGFLALGGTNGIGNVGVGAGAGASITTGTINTCLGPDAGSDFSGVAIGTGTNNILLGFNAAPSTANVSNQITLGNASISSLRCQVTTISALSDIRDKTNVQDSTYGLELINQLRPVTFDWNMRDGAKVGVPDLGFIAQDLAAVEDNYDAERLALTLRDNPERLEATPGRLIPILVKAIQELSAEIQELKNAR